MTLTLYKRIITFSTMKKKTSLNVFFEKMTLTSCLTDKTSVPIAGSLTNVVHIG